MKTSQVTRFDRDINFASEFLSLLGEPNRLRVFAILRYGEFTVTEIFKCLDLKQNLISHHLRVLKEGGIAKNKRKGRKIYYSLDPSYLALFNSVIEKLSIYKGK